MSHNEERRPGKYDTHRIDKIVSELEQMDSGSEFRRNNKKDIKAGSSREP